MWSASTVWPVTSPPSRGLPPARRQRAARRPRLVLPGRVPARPGRQARGQRHVIGVTHRVVRGTLAGIEAVLTATATGTVINTAYIERLNATFRAHLAPLTRRGRAITRTEAALTAGCGSSARPITSAGPTTASASSLPTVLPASGSSALRPWRPGSPTPAGPSTNCSASRFHYLAGFHQNDATGRPTIHLLELRHDHTSGGVTPQTRDPKIGALLGARPVGYGVRAEVESRVLAAIQRLAAK